MSEWTDFRDAVVNPLVPNWAKEAASGAEGAGNVAARTLIKVGEAPKGNQTALELEQSKVSRAIASAASKPWFKYAAGAAALLVFALLLKKGKK